VPLPAPVERLTVAQARRIALGAQGFADPRPTGRVDARHIRRTLDRIGVLQIDSVNVLVRSYELPLFARLGPHSRALLPDLVERRREMFEYWAHEASFVPIGLYPLLRWRMDEARARKWIARHKPPEFLDFADAVLRQVAERGPISSSQLIDAGKKQGPWWGWSDGKMALEYLFYMGAITSAGRGPNFERVYDLTERVIPRAVLDAPVPSLEEAHRQLLLRAARHHGVGTERDLVDYFRMSLTGSRPRFRELVEAGELIPVQVGNWKEIAYLHPGARRPRKINARALLSPFDSLIWERSRAKRLFDAHIRIELYTPAPKRVHGYYVLAFLLGEAIAARVDLKADRKASRLLVQGAHTEDGFEGDVVEPLAAELRLMASWLGLDDVEVKPRGDLAPALTKTLR
jgi:uncharacterized protein YcaQ